MADLYVRTWQPESSPGVAIFDNFKFETGGWIARDLGYVGVAGTTTATSGGVYTVTAAGEGIWYGYDTFRFTYRRMSGDGTIIARVASLQNANSGAKAGVMIREKAQHGAVKFASMMLSGDGVNWQSVGSETISMGSTVYVGLAVTNQSATAQCTVTFDNVSAPGAP